MDVVLNLTMVVLIIIGAVFVVTGLTKFADGVYQDGIDKLLVGQATVLIGAICITLAILLGNVALGNIV